MTIYKLNPDSVDQLPTTTFAQAGIRERDDLQRLLRDRIDVIAPGLLVIAEEFGNWEDSRRRIDLLAVDENANLVVVELKRTEDGGHMELQAVRYAAMVSAITYSKAVEVFTSYLSQRGRDGDAEQTLLDFLGWDAPQEDKFGGDVRIVLASAEFSTELTTSVLWLLDHGIDIRCVKLRPYSHEDQLLLDVQQIIPLPEAHDYQVRLREKKDEARAGKRGKRPPAVFAVTVGENRVENLVMRDAIRLVVREAIKAGASPDDVGKAIHWRPELFLSCEGEVDSSGFFAAVSERLGDKFEPDRWFLKDDDLIHFQGNTYAFSAKWGIRAPKAMRNVIERFDLNHVKIERMKAPSTAV